MRFTFSAWLIDHHSCFKPLTLSGWAAPMTVRSWKTGRSTEFKQYESPSSLQHLPTSSRRPRLRKAEKYMVVALPACRLIVFSLTLILLTCGLSMAQVTTARYAARKDQVEQSAKCNGDNHSSQYQGHAPCRVAGGSSSSTILGNLLITVQHRRVLISALLL